MKPTLRVRYEYGNHSEPRLLVLILMLGFHNCV
jgi:hypothetical protein